MIEPPPQEADIAQMERQLVEDARSVWRFGKLRVFGSAEGFLAWRCPDCGMGLTKIHVTAAGMTPCGGNREAQPRPLG